MRRVHLLLIAGGVLALAPAVAAQQQTQPTAPAAQSHPRDENRQAPADAARAIGSPAAIMAQPVAAPTKATEKKKAKEEKRPHGNNKNPYWEPRDWNYIANQGP